MIELRDVARVVRYCLDCGSYAMTQIARNIWLCRRCDSKSNGNGLDWGGYLDAEDMTATRRDH